MEDQLAFKTGLVCMVDILGYRSILTNNQIDMAARVISDLILELPGTVRAEFEEAAGEAAHAKDFIAGFSDIRWITFSDTICCALGVEEGAGPARKTVLWTSYLGLMCLLLRRCFEAGLPLRGAIAWGPFYSKSHCLAGKPIVEAYECGNLLEMAGCVLAPSAQAELDRLMAYDGNDDFVRLTLNILNHALTRYLVPVKGGRCERFSCLRWGAAAKELKLPPAPDLRAFVISRFMLHNKDMPPGVYAKVDNTEMFLHHLASTFQPYDKPEDLA